MALGYPLVFGAVIVVFLVVAVVGDIREGPDCRDNIPNCDGVGTYSKKELCDTSKYPFWPGNNCEAYCGMCKRTTPCQDKTDQCKSFGAYSCYNVTWAIENCEKTCGLCYDTYQDPSELSSPPPQVPTKGPTSRFLPSGVSLKDREEIIELINDVRANVEPPATDMPKVIWDEHLEDYSQKTTDTCIISVPSNGNLWPFGSTVIAQLGVSQSHNWSSTISFWAGEKISYQYGKEPSSYLGESWRGKIDSYTQLITNSVTRVGCGYTNCYEKNKNFFLCAFLSGHGWTRPYESGEQCASCPNSCVNGLCDCGGLTCLHGQKIDMNCCTCY